MKKILGSILLLLTLNTFAVVTVSVDKEQFYPGDTLHLTISATGKEIQFPSIATIGEYNIIGNSSSQAINIINGKTTKKMSKSYSFKPTKSLTIPSFLLTIDNSEQRTKAIKITKISPQQNSAGDDFILELKTAKNEFFAGEYLDLQVILHKKKSASFNGDINVEPLKTEGLEFFANSGFSPQDTTNYTIYTANYRVRATKIGGITLEPAIAVLSDKILGFGSFFNTRKKRIYSNTLQLNVLPLPHNLTLYGDFTIASSADKSSADSGEAVNVDVVITGKGNIQDIEKFAINIDNATVYTDDPTIKNNTFTQKFAIIAERDFQVPSFKLEYFDKVSQQPKLIHTQAIDIAVKNITTAHAKNMRPAIKLNNNTATAIITPTPVKILQNTTDYFALIISFTLGILATIIVYFFKKRTVKTTAIPIINQIKRAKNDKELFHLLLPLDINKLSNVLQQLEENLYKSGTHNIDKKAVITIMKNL